MPLIKYDELKDNIFQILLRLNFSNEDADLVASHLATSNLLGHHSHGLLRLPQYRQRILDGLINPQAKISHENISPNISLVSGNGGLGQLTSSFSANLVIEKAKITGLAAVGINNVDHTGRIGAFVQQIAEANMLGIYFGNASSRVKLQAPYGGKDPKLAANPIAFAAPRNKLFPLVLDMATTAIANGKVRDAKNRNEAIPADCLLDKEGRPTSNILDYLDGGSLLPFGGKQAYKGFGLALFAEIFAGILSSAYSVPFRQVIPFLFAH